MNVAVFLKNDSNACNKCDMKRFGTVYLSNFKTTLI